MTIILAGTDASALGLGGIRTLSVLNQPFSGEIDIHDVNPDEIDAVKVSIASQEAFAKAGLERYYYLTKLTFSPEISPQGKSLIRVSSSEPIREPYMDLLVEVFWPNGQLVKEYTVLLDPPVLANRRAPTVKTPRAVDAQPGSARSTSGLTNVGSSLSNHIPAPGNGFPVYLGPVESGTGLWMLASRHAPAGATVAQTAMALHRNNQGAFARGNINRLIAGKTLIIPTHAELFALDSASAEREFAKALRGGAVSRAQITSIPPEALSSRLRIAGSIPMDDAAPTGSSPVTGPGSTPATPVSAASPRLEQDLLLALETSESTRQESLELRGRIKELETQLADIQNLLKLREAEFDRLKGTDVAPGALGEVTREVVPQSADVDSKVLADSVSSELSPEATMETRKDGLIPTGPPLLDERLPTDVADTPASTDSSSDLMPVPVPAPAEKAPDPVVGQTDQATPATQTGESTATIAQAGEDQEGQASSPGPSSIWQSLMLPLAGFAGLTALGILAFSWLTSRRRRQADGAETDLPLDTLDFAKTEGATEPLSTLTPEEKAAVAAASAGKADQGAVSETPLTLDQGDEDEEEPENPLSLMSSLSDFDAETDEADVLSEADIYIAYGRHSEAQDLLLKEMKRYPDRLDIKFKLAEAYAGAKDTQGLREMMQSIEAAGGDRTQPGPWKRLQDLSGQIQSGGEAGSDKRAPIADFGAQPRGTGLVSSQDSGRLMADSVDLGESDSLVLDLSDFQRNSEQSAAQSSRIHAANVLKQGDHSPLKFSEDALGDILTEPVSLGDLVMEDDSLELSLPTPAGDKRDDLNQDPFADIAHELTSVDSELVLTLDETRLEVVEDLDSMFDSTVEDEPTLARNEMEGARPSGAEVSPILSSGKKDLTASGLLPAQESVLTEQLSSQWQMDSGIWDETATKLDLARAYLEMDDAEAAREILEEVIAEGRDEQKAEARALLERLA